MCSLLQDKRQCFAVTFLTDTAMPPCWKNLCREETINQHRGSNSQARQAWTTLAKGGITLDDQRLSLHSRSSLVAGFIGLTVGPEQQSITSASWDSNHSPSSHRLYQPHYVAVKDFNTFTVRLIVLHLFDSITNIMNLEKCKHIVGDCAYGLL